MSDNKVISELWTRLYCDEELAFVHEILNLDDQQARVDTRMFTLLHVAVRADDLNLANQLIALGAKVNATDYRGRTPLHDAADRHNPAMAYTLIQSGADSSMKDFQGLIPLDAALADICWVDTDRARLTIEYIQNAE